MVKGFAKGLDYSIGERLEEGKHFWNVVKLNGFWFLVDCSWSRVFREELNDSEEDLDDFYFLCEPEKFIYTHYPLE